MREIRFDSEGITSCPKNETATREECFECKYKKELTIYDPTNSCIYTIIDTCIYEDVFPEPVEAK